MAHDRIEKDPDRRIREVIDLVFAKFAELQTVRQVHLWLLLAIADKAVIPGRRLIPVFDFGIYNDVPKKIPGPGTVTWYSFNGNSNIPKGRCLVTR